MRTRRRMLSTVETASRAVNGRGTFAARRCARDQRLCSGATSQWRSCSASEKSSEDVPGNAPPIPAQRTTLPPSPSPDLGACSISVDSKPRQRQHLIRKRQHAPMAITMSRTRVDVARPTFDDDDDDRSREQVRADSSQALDRPNPINATTPALVPLLFALAPSLTHS